ncbi:TraG family conjugative transposon ATPase [Pedobacter sp. SYP-B3415]|uniref:TraG family conjugative transposon ATPase n=1 Tax=Pedobacter sp. SYP-B3415 TaxID=2496641 RepID=UPI00101D17E3|nr:TraG family conjugative transposon ATPase [Pedobacter sp. SYP-B3415]
MKLEDILPIYQIQNNTLLSRSGEVTLAYSFTLPELFSMSAAEYETIHETFVKSIALLPIGSVFHKQDWFIKDQVKASAEEDSFLSKSSMRHFSGRSFLAHECMVFLTLRPNSNRLSSSSYSNILRKSLSPISGAGAGQVQDFLDKAGQVRRLINQSGLIKMDPISEETLLGNANKAGLLERYLLLLAKNEPAILRDIDFSSGIRVGEKQLQLFSLSQEEELPAFCGPRINYDRYSIDQSKFSVGFASPLALLLDCNHLYNQYVFIQDRDQILRRLEARKLRMQSLSAYSRENAIARDAINEYLNQAVALNRLPVKAHFNVLTWAESDAEAKHVRNLVTSAMSKMSSQGKLESWGAPQIWFAGLPGNEGDFPMNDTFLTFPEQAICFFAIESMAQSSSSAIGIKLGERLSGRPLQVDLSDEPMQRGIITNRNKFILGPSGSGKSFFTNHMVRSYYQQGTHIVLVDVGHSYRGLCSLLEGYYFSYQEHAPISFNPFYLPPGEQPDTEKKESLKAMLLALWKKDDEPFKRSEYVALSGALSLYYEYLAVRSDVFPCFDSFYEFITDQYASVMAASKVKESDFDLANFTYVLRPFYRGGEFDYLLNATSQLDLLEQRLIVFELDAIKDHPVLFPAVTLMIMEVFISKMRKLKGQRKMILIEECWKAIAREGMAEYIKYLFKTVRKFFGEAIVVTQEIEDIISSPIVKQAIINNSDCKILLDQRKYQNKFDDIQQLLGLTEKERTQILSMNRANDPSLRYKEVFISLGSQQSAVYRTEVSLEEYLTYTTEEKEKARVEEYATRYGSMQTGIAVLAREIREQDNKSASFSSA